VTSSPRKIECECHACGERFEAWYRASINLSLGEKWTPEELEAAATATCPRCGAKGELETLVVSW
jgi:DNA-directed RNA polymerase subunit RPC12/RpoP